jgi:hypothetical protein
MSNGAEGCEAVLARENGMRTSWGVGNQKRHL